MSPRDQTIEQAAGPGSPQPNIPGPHEPGRPDGRGQLDLRAVLEKLNALNGAPATVEVHAAGSAPAPRAILSGAVGRVSMDGESKSGDPRGLVFVPIGAEGSTDPGCRPGIYFDEERFAWAEGAAGLTIALDDQTFFVINTAT